MSSRRIIVILASLWLGLPLALFLWFWTAPWVSIPLLAATLWAAWRGLVEDNLADEPVMTPRAWRGVLVSGAIALVWVALSGAGGVGFQNGDYIKHNALLFDLIHRPWPVTYGAEDLSSFLPGENSSPLVYYMGWYLLPAAAGKLGGWSLALKAQFMLTWCGVWLVLWQVSRLTTRVVPERHVKGEGGADPSMPRAAIVGVFFMLASGWDILGHEWVNGVWPPLGTHIEWWAWIAQYSSNSTLLLWVPHQSIAVWLVTGIILEGIARLTSPRTAGLWVVVTLLWSPFGALGVLPLALLWCVYDLWTHRRSAWKHLLTPANLLVAPALALTLGSYLLSNRLAFPIGWVWNLREGFTWPRLALFEALELFPPALVIVLGWKTLSPRSDVSQAALRVAWGLAILLLGLFPLVMAGARNDFPMRSGMALVFVLWVCVLLIAVSSLSRRRDILLAMFGVLAVLGSVTPIFELSRNASDFRGVNADATYNGLARIEPVSDRVQYFGNRETFFFRWLGRERAASGE